MVVWGKKRHKSAEDWLYDTLLVIYDGRIRKKIPSPSPQKERLSVGYFFPHDQPKWTFDDVWVIRDYLQSMPQCIVHLPKLTKQLNSRWIIVPTPFNPLPSHPKSSSIPGDDRSLEPLKADMFEVHSHRTSPNIKLGNLLEILNLNVWCPSSLTFHYLLGWPWCRYKLP